MIATDIVGSRVESGERSYQFRTRPGYHAALLSRLDAMVLDLLDSHRCYQSCIV